MDADAKPRVFMSSLIAPAEFKLYRQAAARAIERAGCQVVRAEDHPAGPVGPHTACLDMVASSDAVVTILGPKYGGVMETGRSATHDEYVEAVRLHKRVYLFLEKSDVPMEPEQDKFVKSVTGYVGDNWRKTFSTPDELEGFVLQALKEDKDLIESSGNTGNNNLVAMVHERISAVLAPIEGRGRGMGNSDSTCWLKIVWAPLRDEEVVKATDFMKASFQRDMMRIGHNGDTPLFSYTEGQKPDMNSTRLQIVQGGPSTGRGGSDRVTVDIYPSGTLSVMLNINGSKELGMEDITAFAQYFLDPDAIRTRLEQAWGYAAEFWGFVDALRRYNALFYNVALYNVGMSKLGKAPQGRAGLQLSIKEVPDPLILFPRPHRISRAELLAPGPEIEETLDMLQLRFGEIDRR